MAMHHHVAAKDTSRLAVLCTLCSPGYVVFGGQYIQFGYDDEDYNEEEFDE